MIMFNMHDGGRKTFQKMTSSIPPEIPSAIAYPSIEEISVVSLSADFAKPLAFPLYYRFYFCIRFWF